MGMAASGEFWEMLKNHCSLKLIIISFDFGLLSCKFPPTQFSKEGSPLIVLVYFYKIEVGEFCDFEKMIFLR
jgi:hypothetical protein